MLPGPSPSKVTTLWHYTNLFIIIIIITGGGLSYCSTKLLLGYKMQDVAYW